MSKGKMKQRFSDEQIRLLESMFDSESRPESQAKQQIADQLGLKPRQVAIWFQNRRARSKLKQIEHDYRILKSNYEKLETRFDSLKNENRHLNSELQRLKGTEDRIQEATMFDFNTSSFHVDKRPNDVDEFKGDQQTEVLSMVEALSGSTSSSSGNGYRLESVLEPDYLAEDKCGSDWWEAY